MQGHKPLSFILACLFVLAISNKAQAANCSMIMGQTDDVYGMTSTQIIDTEAAAGGHAPGDLTGAYVVIDYTSTPGSEAPVAVCHSNNMIAHYMGSMVGVYFTPFAACNVSGPCTTVNATCGTADGTPTSTAPTSNLCGDGSMPSVAGTGPWTWTCAGTGGGSDAACSAPVSVNGECGPANNTPTGAAPGAGLCNAGTPTAVSGTGPWSWICNGLGGGTNQSCAAPLPPPPPSFGGICP